MQHLDISDCQDIKRIFINIPDECIQKTIDTFRGNSEKIIDYLIELEEIKNGLIKDDLFESQYNDQEYYHDQEIRFARKIQELDGQNNIQSQDIKYAQTIDQMEINKINQIPQVQEKKISQKTESKFKSFLNLFKKKNIYDSLEELQPLNNKNES